MLFIVDITEERRSTRNGTVFFDRLQIFSHSAGDTLPDRNFFNSPVLIDSGTFFKYLSVFLARALLPLINPVVDRPMPAADNKATMPSTSSDLVNFFQP